ncbi:hypothetical protein D3C71_1406280 [compost metagenome]
MFPVIVVTLVFQPECGKEGELLQSLDPAVAPRVANDLRIKRTALISKHDGAPPQIVVQQEAAHVVNVVGITVVGRIGGDDGFQCRRTAGGDLQAVEAAPALAHHADIAAAPRLAGNPVDHLECVVLFLLQIFVCHVAIGFACATHVHANRGISLAGKIAVHRLVAPAGSVSLAIGNILENGGNRRLFRALRQPKAST